LTRTGTRTVALLQADTGAGATLLGAWTRTAHGSCPAPFRLRGAAIQAASFGGSHSVAMVVNGHRGETLAGPGATWQPLPALPPESTVTLAAGPAGATGALAASGSTLTIWRHEAGSSAWARAQTIKVPIQYGSSS
jgi:hypothetical protein